jgi:hypothetical protein
MYTHLQNSARGDALTMSSRRNSKGRGALLKNGVKKKRKYNLPKVLLT